MKSSISSIFSSIFSSFLVISFISFIAIFLLIDHQNSYKKYQNILAQKHILKELVSLNIQSPNRGDLAQTDAKIIYLQNQHAILKNLSAASLVEGYLSNYKLFEQELPALAEQIDKLSSFMQNDNKKPHTELLALAISLDSTLDQLVQAIINIDAQKTTIIKSLLFILIASLLLFATIHKKRLAKIYADLLYLLDASNNKYNFYSNEAEAILLRMKKPTQSSQQEEALPNLKAFASEFNKKQHFRQEAFTSIAVFKVDDLDDLERIYPSEFIDSITNKIAQTMRLYLKNSDVLGYENSEFYLAITRASKKECYLEMQTLKANITDLKYTSIKTGAKKIFLSGGFVIKPNSKDLESAIKEARELLSFAQESGGNNLADVRDLVAGELQ